MGIFEAFSEKSKAKTERIDVVVSGYFGYGNSGDDTVLDRIVFALRKKNPNVGIAVLCHDPKRFGDMHGVLGIGRYSLREIVGALKKARMLISGGGSLLQNATSSRSLFYYAGVIVLAKLCGAKVCICNNGIGPLRGRIGRWIAYRAVMMADRVSVRDPESKKLLEEIGVPPDKVSLGADPAFMLALGNRTDVSLLKHRLGMSDSKKYFAVSIRASLCSNKNEEELCRACRDIYLNLGLVPVFVSMQESEDCKLCHRIASETCGEAVTVPSLSAESLCSLLGNMEMVLTMRLHLMIYAAAVGTPSVGISIDPKLDAMGDILGSAKSVCKDGISSVGLLSLAKETLSADRDALFHIAVDQAKRAEADLLESAEVLAFDESTAQVGDPVAEE